MSTLVHIHFFHREKGMVESSFNPLWLNVAAAIMSIISVVLLCVIYPVCRGILNFSKWKTVVDGKLENLEKFADKSSETLDWLVKQVTELQTSFDERVPPNFLKTSSPIGLAERGKKLSEKINGAAWAQNQIEEIEASNKDHISDWDELEIQERAFSYAKNYTFEDEFKKQGRLAA